MRFLRRFVLPVAGVATIALLIAIASPRAVRAVTAALVQVVNTPANAVPSVHAPAASQLYRHRCTSLFHNNEVTYCSLPMVPAGQTLFVDAGSFTATVEAGNGPIEASIDADVTLSVPMSLMTTATSEGITAFVGTVPSRASFMSGWSPSCYVVVAQNSYGSISCSVYGYLVPAQ